LAPPLLAQQKKAGTPPPATAKEAEVKKVQEAMPEKATAKPKKARRLLVFYRCEGFVHSCIPLACRALQIMGKKTGAFEAVCTQEMEVFNPEHLNKFDAVLFNNTTRLAFEKAEHRKALMDFVKGGKGVVGLHAATDNFYNWPEAAAMMGGLFDGHPWTANGTWAVKIDEPDHTLNKAFNGKGFTIKDEIYQMKAPYSRKNLRVLLSLDAENPLNHKINPKGVHRTDKDFAIAWLRTFGKGRVFYCSLGHNHEVFWNKAVLQHYLDGIQYALGDLDADAKPSAESGAVKE
jgi:type 1 glutamine amidotransferase